MSSLTWKIFQIAIVASFIYVDWEIDMTNGRPGVALVAGIITAASITACATAFFDLVSRLFKKLSGKVQ